MKIDTQKTILQETEQPSLLEELIPDTQKSGILTELRELIDETEKDKEELKLNQIVHDSKLLLGIITEQAQKKRIWQIVAVCLMIFFVVTSFVGYRFYMERENQIEKLSQANASVKKVSTNLSHTNQEIETLEKQSS